VTETVDSVVGGVVGGSGGGDGASTGGSGTGSGSGGDSGAGSTAGSGAAGGDGGATAGASGTGTAPRATARPPRQVRASQSVIRNTGDPRDRRAAVLTFRLARAAVVRFRIRQEAPRCLVIGAFSVQGHAGRNRVRFTGRYRGVTLPAGTYTLTGHAFRNGRVTPLGTATVVIVPAGVAEAARQPTTCDGPRDGVDATAAAALLASARGNAVRAGDAERGAKGSAQEGTEGVAGSVEETNDAGDGGEGDREAAGAAAGGGDDDEGTARPILGVPNPFDEAPTWVQPLLLIALASAILLLLLAAIPATAVRPINVAPAVVRRRSEFALAGAMILGAVAIAALIV
jgi:hypothetical protein